MIISMALAIVLPTLASADQRRGRHDRGPAVVKAERGPGHGHVYRPDNRSRHDEGRVYRPDNRGRHHHDGDRHGGRPSHDRRLGRHFDKSRGHGHAPASRPGPVALNESAPMVIIAPLEGPVRSFGSSLSFGVDLAEGASIGVDMSDGDSVGLGFEGGGVSFGVTLPTRRGF
jgi:hypothetical protein